MKFTTDVELPEWTRWIAQDLDGVWFAYAIKPTSRSDYWMTDNGGLASIFLTTPGNKDWEDTLYEVTWS